MGTTPGQANMLHHSQLLKFVLLLTSITLTDELYPLTMTDNILSDSKIKEIELNINYQSHPFDYIDNLLKSYPNSYYLQSLYIYFDTDMSRIILNSEKLDGINNTFALFGTSIRYRYSNESVMYMSLIKKSIATDLKKINRWPNLELFNRTYDESPIEAEGLWNKLVLIYPDFLYLYLSKAEILRTSGAQEDAIQLLLQFERKFKTNNSDISCKIGESYLALNKFDIAETYFNASLLTKENAYSYNGIGWICFFKGNYEMARDNNIKALSIIPDEPEFCWRYATVLNILNEKDSSYAYFKKAIENCHDMTPKELFYISYVDCLIVNGEYQDALEEYNIYNKEYNSILYKNKYDIAFSYFLNNEFNVANSIYNKFTNENPKLKEEMDIELNSIGVDMRLLISE